MIEYIFWAFSFVSLYITLIWIQIYFLEKLEIRLEQIYPNITIAVPVYNEEKTLKQTIISLTKLIYPKNKMEILIINDGSTDNTKKIAEQLEKQHKNIRLINQDNKGKAAALNTALKQAKGEIFACVDADSLVSPSSLKKIVRHFSKENLGAVISFTQVHKPKNLIEKLQWLEYVFTAFIRKLMTKIGTLYTTPGVLSVYRTSTIKKIGGFDENNLTEDLEIAMRLQYNHYDLDMETNSRVYTKAPDTFMGLWRQRVRWYRGLIFNMKKYRKMIFSRKHGLMGVFQIPLILITIFMLTFGAGIILYRIISWLYVNMQSIILLKADFIDLLRNKSLIKTLLSLNIKFYFPIAVIIILVVYMFQKAYKQAKTDTRYHKTFLFYLFIYPLIHAMHWIAALLQELTRRKKKW